jgi:type II secretory pathway component PulK
MRMRVLDRADQRGVALVLVLIFSILLYVLVAELVTTARMARLTGENDALLVRMRSQADYTVQRVEEMLLDDLLAAGGEGEGGGLGGAMGGAAGGGAPSAGGLGGEAGGEADEGAAVESSRDNWYQPTGFADGDLTTYVWVEDENRKFNILTLASPDEEFARKSRERFIRLIDVLREDTELDLTSAEATQIADEFMEWIETRTRDEERIPRPKLKSDSEARRELSIPLHLDEVMMLRSVTGDLFFDKVLDGRVIPGLESVMTVYTSLVFDPGDPEKIARQRAQSGQPPPPPVTAPESEAPPSQPEGVGIRININTAPRAVLRSLFSPGEIPDLVIDAILRFRNEEVEDLEEEPEVEDYLGDVELGAQVTLKIFTDVRDVEQIPEFQNLPNPDVKEEFYRLTTVNSDVFSIHIASMFRRNEESRVYVLKRVRSVMMRMDNGEDGYLHPLILQEQRYGMRIVQSDFPDDYVDLFPVYNEMDYYAQEERAWNPFFVDFYLPPDQRQNFYVGR